MQKPPTVSILIATYNWSTALRCALESVLLQTVGDFEVLVTGDGCTDDSESVVRSFGDDRLLWNNLPVNVGSQFGPNNFGLAKARGSFIAYLGHDDLWWPTHLQNALHGFSTQGADVVCSGALLFANPESGVRSVTGFFPNNRFSPRHFFPPSSMLHTRKLGQRIRGWRSPEQARVAVDCDFLQRCFDMGARFASTADITAFKFNAAWRRDCYRHNTAPEQEAFLREMRERGEAFRREQLTQTIRAAIEDKLHKLELSGDPDRSAADFTRINAGFKGVAASTCLRPQQQPDGRRRYRLTNAYAGFEWHPIEDSPLHGTFRWSGPSRVSTVKIPEDLSALGEIRVLIVSRIHRDVLRFARFYLNGQLTKGKLKRGPGDALIWTAVPGKRPQQHSPEGILDLTIEVHENWRPVDLGINEDRRWLGLAVSWVEAR
jgi:glycosyltransferase involved in cell wall biosynthesis